jgi:hypothetical protein
MRKASIALAWMLGCGPEVHDEDDDVPKPARPDEPAPADKEVCEE